MIVIVDYGVGNLRSIKNMLERAGFDAHVSREHDVISSASKLILPGVGHFGYAMQSLHIFGLVDLLNRRVLEDRVPILGICLGAQLLGRRSEEGDCPGLNWVPMETVRFDTTRINGEKVPHMGWAETSHSNCTLFRGMTGNPRFYYVHSYHFHCDDPQMAICTAQHGYRFVSGVAYDNILGVQFHPEKSHVYGQHLLKNFASMPIS